MQSPSQLRRLKLEENYSEIIDENGPREGQHRAAQYLKRESRLLLSYGGGKSCHVSQSVRACGLQKNTRLIALELSSKYFRPRNLPKLMHGIEWSFRTDM